MNDGSIEHLRCHGGDAPLIAANERGTRVVLGLTLATMIAELGYGDASGSVALTADGWHMATHTEEIAARMLAGRSPDDTGQGHHDRQSHHDHNHRAAYLHLLADAVTRVLAIVALGLGRWRGWSFLDPLIGAVGGLVVLRWGIGPCRSAGRQLVYATGSPEVEAGIRAALEALEDVRVMDVHCCSPGPASAAPSSRWWRPGRSTRPRTNARSAPVRPSDTFTSKSRSAPAVTRSASPASDPSHHPSLRSTMPQPERSLPLAAPRPSSRGLLGLALSVLCFIHCVGAAAFLPFLPSAFALLVEHPALEGSLLALSVGLTGRLCWRHARTCVHLAIWGAMSASGIAGLLLECEAAAQGALGGLAALQLVVLGQTSRRAEGRRSR